MIKMMCPHCGHQFDGPKTLTPAHRLSGQWDKRCPGVGSIPHHVGIDKPPQRKPTEKSE